MGSRELYRRERVVRTYEGHTLRGIHLQRLTQRSAVTPYAMMEAVPFGSIVFEEDSIWPLSRTSHVVSVGPRSKCRIDPSDDARSPFRQHRIVDWPSRRQPSSHPIVAFPGDPSLLAAETPVDMPTFSILEYVFLTRDKHHLRQPNNRKPVKICPTVAGVPTP